MPFLIGVGSMIDMIFLTEKVVTVVSCIVIDLLHQGITGENMGVRRVQMVVGAY